ncbi:hypothetical protein KKF97_04550 [Myxococcota bacterium]|nr:hypothetical protein [Myxococcota bacterium]
MKIVIQCAGKKASDAGNLYDSIGGNVTFIAHPELIAPSETTSYQRPDDITNSGLSWRQELVRYNAEKENPLNLLPAYKLYANRIYQDLVHKFGVKNVFILSAGWGLINSEFLTPSYDITFSSSADKYKKRRKTDNYDDLCLLPFATDDDLIFLGGKDYLSLFAKLTEKYCGKRIVFYNSIHKPEIGNCIFKKFQTKTKTNWHYGCARAILDGTVEL